MLDRLVEILVIVMLWAVLVAVTVVAWPMSDAGYNGLVHYVMLLVIGVPVVAITISIVGGWYRGRVMPPDLHSLIKVGVTTRVLDVVSVRDVAQTTYLYGRYIDGAGMSESGIKITHEWNALCIARPSLVMTALMETHCWSSERQLRDCFGLPDWAEVMEVV